jgi:hypothetical protein
MFKKDMGSIKPPKETSAPQNTAVGSGSRPNSSKMAIETSAPANAHTLGRDPGGALK